ncbi:MAG TPA: TetR/AcrR family transcriptional regulator [Micromonospora sp.]
MTRNATSRKRPDPRAEATRRQLAAAVLELASQRDLHHITISDIAQRAGVNRATVYLHSADRDSLLATALEPWIAQIAELAAHCCPKRSTAPAATPPPQLVALFEEFERQAPLLRRVLGDNGSGKLINRIFHTLRDHMSHHLSTDGHAATIPHDLHAAYLSGAILGVLRYWLSRDTTPPVPEIAATTWKLINNTP